MAAETQIIPIRDDQPTPMNVIQMAISQGADVERLTKLFELQERWEANEARKAFYAAMQEFKRNPPHITKNGTGHNNAKYATLDHACGQIVPALAAVGISHKWDTKVADGKIVVRCVLSHEMGYSDPNPPMIEAGADTSGAKNAIQAIGSAIKYMERYTLFAAVGLDDGSKDDDGQASSKSSPETRMPEEKAQEWVEAIRDAGSFDELKDTYSKAQKAAQSFGDTDALRKFGEAKNEQYRKLARGANHGA